MSLLVLHRKTTAGTYRRNDTLDDIQIELNYDMQGNLESGDYEVHTRCKDNLPAHIRGKVIYHEWKYDPGNSYKVPFEGQSQECEFINRHWYWIEWDHKRNDGKGCYTFNPTKDYIIALKEYGLGTKEDHYREPKENLNEGDESSEETESSKSKGQESTQIASSPVEQLAKSLGEYIATKETQQIVQATEQLSLGLPQMTMATATIA